LVVSSNSLEALQIGNIINFFLLTIELDAAQNLQITNKENEAWFTYAIFDVVMQTDKLD